MYSIENQKKINLRFREPAKKGSLFLCDRVQENACDRFGCFPVSISDILFLKILSLGYKEYYILFRGIFIFKWEGISEGISCRLRNHRNKKKIEKCY